MIEYLVIAGAVSITLAFVDKENLIPQLSQNPDKKWFFDGSRYAPKTTPAPMARQVDNSEQVYWAQVRAQERWEKQHAASQSKYSLTAH